MTWRSIRLKRTDRRATGSASWTVFALAGVLGLAGAPIAVAEEATPPGAVYKSDIPAAQRRAFFGDMHLHTTMSFDAWTFGTKITPDQAYKFGRGETVMVPAEQVAAQEHRTGATAVPARRAWPLDFMAVTDHSESMGVFNQFDDPKNPLSSSPTGKALLKDPHQAFYMVADQRRGPPANLNAPTAMRSAWEVEVKAANANYAPGKFTTFIAYEWTSMAEGKYNLHRNVFFNGDHAPLPFTSRRFATAGGPLDLPGEGPRPGRRRHRHPAQRQRLRRADVRLERLRRPADRRGLRPAPRAERAPDRDRPEQGPVGHHPRTVAQRRVRQLRDLRPPAHLPGRQEQAERQLHPPGLRPRAGDPVEGRRQPLQVRRGRRRPTSTTA